MLKNCGGMFDVRTLPTEQQRRAAIIAWLDDPDFSKPLGWHVQSTRCACR